MRGFAPAKASPKRARGLVAVMGLAAVLAGCGRGGGDWRQAQSPAPPPSAAEALDYLSPPQVTGAERGADGAVTLAGRAGPDVTVRLSSPDGGAYGATAADDGAWTITLPAAQAAREFGLSEDFGGRQVQGEGYFVVLPGDGPAAVLLRAGEGAVVERASAAGRPALAIAAIDFDQSGAVVVSGRCAPQAAVGLRLDGAVQGEGRCEETGGFSISGSAVLKPGAHEAEVAAAGRAAMANFTISPPAAFTSLPYQAQRLAGAWRIDWLTPGGGPQTTLILDP